MIGTSSIVGIVIMAAGGVFLPVAVCIWWLFTKKEKLTTVLTGAAVFFVFAMILERIPISLLYNPATSVGQTILGNVALYTIIGALLAGIFEETGRFLAFKTILKNRTNKETSVSYGIGHGGMEAILLVGVAGAQYLIYASMIDSGLFEQVIAEVAATGTDVTALEAIPAQIMAITPLNSLLALSERGFAMLLHVGLSILVFYAVREKKTQYYFWAIALHALMDVPAALYQTGVANLYVVEAMLAVYVVVFFVLVYRKFYLKMK